MNSLRSSICRRSVDRGALETRRLGELPDPEDLAEDGCVLDERLLLERERVEARGDDPLHRVRQRELLAVLLAGQACGRTPRRRGDCRPLARGAPGPPCRRAPRAAASIRRRKAARGRSSRRCACRRPSRAGVRGARAAPCTPPGAERRSPTRGGSRRSRGVRRRPSEDPRKRGRPGTARRVLRRSGARPRTLLRPVPRLPASPLRPTSGRRWPSIQRASAESSIAWLDGGAQLFSATSASSLSRIPA